MKKELDELKAVEKHLAELKKKIEEQTKEDAKVWLKDYISKPFEMKINTEEQTITYFRDGVWIFEQDLKNKKFWYSDYNFYYDFKVKFELNFDETDQLIKDVVLKPFNCDGLTPYLSVLGLHETVLKPFNCKWLTPELTF